MRSILIFLPVILVASSLGLHGASAQEDDGAIPLHRERVDLLAYYYPWYDQGDWRRHPYVGTPTLGEYGSDDPAVAEQHIAWCTTYGIDGLCVSWWGEDTQTDRHLRLGLLSAANADEIKFCIYYESFLLDAEDGQRDGRVDFSVPGVEEKFIADMTYLANVYFERENYYRIEGRPVVGMYVTRTFMNFTAELAQQMREEVGVDIFLIGDEVYFGDQGSPITAIHGKDVFDAYSAYNMHTDPKINDGESAWAYMEREAWPVYREWAEDENVWFMPGIMPSYKDFRGHDSLTGNPDEFEQMLSAAAEMAAGDLAGSKGVIFITSFNEWWEGSTIEPTDEYAVGYLEAIAHWREATEQNSE